MRLTQALDFIYRKKLSAKILLPKDSMTAIIKNAIQNAPPSLPHEKLATVNVAVFTSKKMLSMFPARQNAYTPAPFHTFPHLCLAPIPQLSNISFNIFKCLIIRFHENSHPLIAAFDERDYARIKCIPCGVGVEDFAQ